MRQTFEVWMASDNRMGATFIGKAEGDNFKDACSKVCGRLSDYHEHYDPVSNTVWSCGLYPSRAEANGFQPAHTVDMGDRFRLMVGTKVLMEAKCRSNGSRIEFSDSGYLGMHLCEMVNKLNMERCDR